MLLGTHAAVLLPVLRVPSSVLVLPILPRTSEANSSPQPPAAVRISTWWMTQSLSRVQTPDLLSEDLVPP